VSDDVVTRMAKAMYEGAEELKATSPLWAEYDPATIGKPLGLEYHPAAAAYYQSVATN
jgi:TRAP-type uncharacterized transport system substrate-binding protein